MSFTALHRLLGRQPGPLTNDMLDEAIAQEIRETDDLDWKKEKPEQKGIPQKDFPKDVAAMANAGGGVIVYGVTEKQKAATGRVDVGDVDENYERTLRSAAVTAISPPIFGLGVHRLGDEAGRRALAVIVPPSIDVPHLIYKGEFFGAPVRNDADTVWMRERQIEAMYRARLDERRNAHDALDGLYDEIAAVCPTGDLAWMIGVARPRVPATVLPRVSREDAGTVVRKAKELVFNYADRGAVHPFEKLDGYNLRPGLRRWVAPSVIERDVRRWKESWASVHDDGSVSLASAVGGHPIGGGKYSSGNRVISDRMELFAAALMALLRSSSERHPANEYEVKVGVEWVGAEPLIVESGDTFGATHDGSLAPMARYAPVMTSVSTVVDEQGFASQVRELATDLINQGGVWNLRRIKHLPVDLSE